MDLASMAQVTPRGSPGVLGIGKAGGSLEKLTIQYEQGRARNFTGEVVALFNPNEFTITQQMAWEATGYRLHFKGDSSTPATLQLALFFDTYAGNRGMPSPGIAPSRTSVTTYTEEVANLIRIDRDLHRPPICKLLWGRLQLLRGVLTDLSQQFTLFQADGTPVRATLTCSFQQFRSTDLTLKELDLHSADVPKTRTVRQGDTLSSIAAEEYHDPSQWRHIAAANSLHNPRALTPRPDLAAPEAAGLTGGRRTPCLASTSTSVSAPSMSASMGRPCRKRRCMTCSR